MPAPQPRPTAVSPRAILYFAIFLFAVAAGAYEVEQLIFVPMREKQMKIEELEAKKRALEETIARLKQSTRRAQVYVLDQGSDEKGKWTQFRFVELTPDGQPLNAGRTLKLPGDEIYFDAMVIKFDDKFVEQGDKLKGQALLLFRRIFSNKLKPDDGEILDKNGEMPEVYAAKNAPTKLEQDLWTNFWKLANDPESAKKFGVRALQGDAPYTKLEKDRFYIIELRATGELTITSPVGLGK